MVCNPIRILIVDDSRIFRGILESVISKIPDAVIVGSVFNGEKALEFLRRTPVDLVTLDIEMPGVNGLETLKAIRELNRSQPNAVQTESVLISSLTKQGAKSTVEGLQLGAIDFILKPNEGSEAENLAALHSALFSTLQLFRMKYASPSISVPGRMETIPRPITQIASGVDSRTKPLASGFKAIAIGISTGGPETLAKMLPDLVGKTKAPIFIVQHNLNGLSGYMADSLTRRLGQSVFEAQENMVVVPGGVYMAQSGSHMILRQSSGNITIGLSDAPPENHSRPAVDVFLRSASATYGPTLVTAIMTGMLDDGAKGVRVVKRAGGFVIAQDQATSVIWGMPRAAIETGCVDLVLPLDKFAPTLLELTKGMRDT